MNAKDKPNGSKSTLQSTSHLVVQGNSLVRSFITEMSVNQLKLFYYLIGTVEKNDNSFYVVDVTTKRFTVLQTVITPPDMERSTLMLSYARRWRVSSHRSNPLRGRANCQGA